METAGEDAICAIDDWGKSFFIINCFVNNEARENGGTKKLSDPLWETIYTKPNSITILFSSIIYPSATRSHIFASATSVDE